MSVLLRVAAATALILAFECRSATLLAVPYGCVVDDQDTQSTCSVELRWNAHGVGSVQVVNDQGEVIASGDSGTTTVTVGRSPSTFILMSAGRRLSSTVVEMIRPWGELTVGDLKCPKDSARRDVYGAQCYRILSWHAGYVPDAALFAATAGNRPEILSGSPKGEMVVTVRELGCEAATVSLRQSHEHESKVLTDKQGNVASARIQPASVDCL